MSDPRRTGLRRRLSLTLVGVALVSVLLLSAVNFVFARALIDDSVESQLEGVRDTRVQAVSNGIARIESQVAALAADPSLAAALVELADGYGRLDDDISAEQIDGLVTVYETENLPPFVAAGVDIPATSLVPKTAAGRSVQELYIASNPNPPDERALLDDAGDGSDYSAAHAAHHPLLRQLSNSAGLSDLLLVDADSQQVVYSVKKRIELGTNGLSWPGVGDQYPNIQGIGSALEQLGGIAVGDASLSDAVFYIPTAGEPVLFVAAAVRSGSSVVGALVAEIPATALTDLMTAGQDWELLGLEKTGEAYVVGPDRTLRSESRVWIEDPQDYLRRAATSTDDERVVELIETVGSPILIQQVDNAAVDAALEGDEFTGTVRNYLDTEVLATAAPIAVSGLDWAVIVEQDTSESDAALRALVRAMLVVLAILLPLIALIGWLLARMLTRPVDVLVGAAARIADGHLDTEVEDLGRNELGDVGRQLEGVARQLASREQAIVGEEQRIIDMLRAALPGRLVERVRSGEQGIEDIFDTATAIALTIDGIPEAAGADVDLALELADRLAEEADALMERFGAERVQRSSGGQLYLTGLDQDDARSADAAAFVFAAIERVAAVGAEFGQDLSVRAGLAAGDVATGVLGNQQLSFGAWGDPPGIAVSLASLAQPGEVLADASVVTQLGRDWDVGPLEELPGLADDIDAQVLNGPIGAPPTPTPR